MRARHLVLALAPALAFHPSLAAQQQHLDILSQKFQEELEEIASKIENATREKA